MDKNDDRFRQILHALHGLTVAEAWRLLAEVRKELRAQQKQTLVNENHEIERAWSETGVSGDALNPVSPPHD